MDLILIWITVLSPSIGRSCTSSIMFGRAGLIRFPGSIQCKLPVVASSTCLEPVVLVVAGLLWAFFLVTIGLLATTHEAMSIVQ